MLSATTDPQTSPRPTAKRLVSALASLSLAIAVSACTGMNPRDIEQVGLPSGATVLTISAYDGSEPPAFEEVLSSESQRDADFSDEPVSDGLSSMLRELPWSTR